MNVVVPTLLCFAAYLVGYRVYARYIAGRIFAVDAERRTPAHTLNDGVDYVPAKKLVVFGHHFASITGLAPMLGPAVAVIWGWLPAMVWVVGGAILVGCVHDFAALVVSLRARGMSIGKVAEGVIGSRAKTLFHLVIFFGVALAMGVFVYVIATLFQVELAAGSDGQPGPPGYPGAVTPSVALIGIALVVGNLFYKRGLALGPLAAIAFVLSLGFVGLGYLYPTMGLADSLWPKRGVWIGVLLTYALVASILPVWVLLQARDFVNSLLLYLGLAAAYVGVFVAAPEFQAPALRTAVDGAPPIYPFVFIIIACGAASGFHGLVSSGTTAKQLDSESDARFVGYGGMIAESSLGLLAVLATTAGFANRDAWSAHYHDWASVQGLGGNIAAFIGGSARFIAALGAPMDLAAAFIAVVVVSFALTTLDSATRLLRYNIEEIGETLGIRLLGNRYVSSVAAVIVIGAFALYRVDGRPAALALWTLFGTTNQLLAGLTLLTATLYLRQRGRSTWVTGLPAVFMLGSAVIAMAQKLIEFQAKAQWLLAIVGGALFVLAVWLVIEAVLAMRSERRETDWQIRITDNDAVRTSVG
ncbi:MAG: carbon starvation protein A [Myxococcota bacterium]